MDVRCERCQTEYELDDASIPEAGVPVQCTTCGYTFSVKRNTGPNRAAVRRPTGPLPGAEPLPVTREDLPVAPATAPWVLQTEDGKNHRLRDMTTLQKWVVERRVTSADRLSRDGGGSWRDLGQVEELAPFFSVVSEADRAKPSTSGLAPSPTLERPRARTIPVRPLSESLAFGGADGPGLERGPAREPLALLEEPRFDVPEGADFGDHDLTPPRRRGPIAAAVLLLLAGAAGGAAYVWRDKLPVLTGRLAPSTPTPAAPEPALTSTATSPTPPAPTPPTTATSPAPTPPAAAAPSPAAAPPPSAGTVLPAPAGTPPSASGAAPTPGPAPAPTAEGAPAGAADGPAGKSGPARPATYERFVAEADKLLENGQTNRAERLYTQALAQKPDGVSALTGTGYVFLDRGRTQKALETFQRALALDPRHGPALFGLAEAYRAQGDQTTALATYRRYLGVNPGGSDAAAARRQVHDLEMAARPPAPEDSP